MGRSPHLSTAVGCDGTRLTARCTGSGEPVVFVHGSGGGLDSWDPVLGSLTDFETWTFARRGPGGGPTLYVICTHKRGKTGVKVVKSHTK